MTPPVISAEDVKEILSKDSGRVELHTTCQDLEVDVDRDSIKIGGNEISRGELEKIGSGNVLYTVKEGKLAKLQLFQAHLYKLAPTGGYPALEIDGIRMHRTKDMLPEEEARVKIDCLDIRRGQAVLDICTGLGYSSQEVAGRGASVLTVEKNPQVIHLSMHNPCSRDFFHYRDLGIIDLVIGDASRLVEILPDKYFNRIIHDPPSFSLAGELYSSAFYHQLRRLIRNDGILLHYTGQPGSRYRRHDLKRGVSRRLREAGFITKWNEMARSVLAHPGGRLR
jgi:predicted methyltransferase